MMEVLGTAGISVVVAGGVAATIEGVKYMIKRMF